MKLSALGVLARAPRALWGGGPPSAAMAAIFGLGLLAMACGGSAPAAKSAAAPKATPAAALVKTATVTVGGQSENILTDGKGRTLYLFTPEKDSKIVTTAAILQIWPALLLSGSSPAPSGDSSLPGQLGTATRPDGTRQVTYNEWPLYTYAGDSKPGDVKGQGFGNQWFVVQSAMAMDADEDFDGTQPSAPPAPSVAPAQPAAQTPAQAAPAPVAPRRPAFNDGDADNNGGPNDGDGNG